MKLSFLKPPTEILKETDAVERTVTTKHAIVEGPLACIDSVIQKRLNDRLCIQGPRKAVSSPYQVAIWYNISDTGSLWLDVVRVSFNDGETWIVFYDKDWCRSSYPADMSWNRESRQKWRLASHLQYHFMDDNDRQKLVTTLLKHEEVAVIQRLVKKGPKVFETDPDLADDQIPAHVLAEIQAEMIEDDEEE